MKLFVADTSCFGTRMDITWTTVRPNHWKQRCSVAEIRLYIYIYIHLYGHCKLCLEMGKAFKIRTYSGIFVATLLALRIDRDCNRFCFGYEDEDATFAGLATIILAHDPFLSIICKLFHGCPSILNE